ncbi:MAG: hypothetical protein NTV99_03915 [Deltaproteobacteria bacterium]|nr:hypothetical protein [Deltaproteobacteria bacterium]
MKEKSPERKRQWLILLGAGIAVFCLLAAFAVTYLDAIITKAVNHYGPRLTKTDVRIEDVRVSLLTGEAKLKDFYLGNPGGFRSAQAMTAESITIRIDEKSLAESTVIIDRIEIAGPEIAYEKVLDTDNFKVILKNVRRATGLGKNPGENAGDKKILIRNFIVRGGKVHLVKSSLGGNTVSADLPDFHYRNKSKKGKPPSEAFGEIIEELYEQVKGPVVTAALDQSARDIGCGTTNGFKSLVSSIWGPSTTKTEKTAAPFNQAPFSQSSAAGDP